MFNLGGPRNLDEVETFLFNMFSDKELIGIPKLAARFLAKRRANKEVKQKYEVSHFF